MINDSKQLSNAVALSTTVSFTFRYLQSIVFLKYRIIVNYRQYDKIQSLSKINLKLTKKSSYFVFSNFFIKNT